MPLDLAVPPDRVFAAFTDPSLRKRWFRVPSEPGASHHELDFRVGGHEIARGAFAGGLAYVMNGGGRSQGH